MVFVAKISRFSDYDDVLFQLQLHRLFRHRLQPRSSPLTWRRHWPSTRAHLAQAPPAITSPPWVDPCLLWAPSTSGASGVLGQCMPTVLLYHRLCHHTPPAYQTRQWSPGHEVWGLFSLLLKLKLPLILATSGRSSEGGRVWIFLPRKSSADFLHCWKSQ